MAFMSNNSGGSFNDYIKYNAKAGRWYTKLDSDNETEVQFQALVDLSRLQTGWFQFEAGMAPDRRLDDQLGIAGPKPTDKHKRGFQCLMIGQAIGGVREFSTTAGVVIDAFNLLHDQYVNAPESAQGKLPVVKCASVNPVTGKHGTNYQPVLEIVGWAEAPQALAEAKMEGSSTGAVAQGQPQQEAFSSQRQTATHTPPPGQQANAVSGQPLAAASGGNLF